VSERLRPASAPAGGSLVIMVIGVNGTGKTTTSASWRGLQGGGEGCAPCGGDTFRAAAIEQLEVWANRNGILPW
jgi:fused signal recognition particle receptor